MQTSDVSQRHAAYVKSLKRRKRGIALCQLLILILFFAFWEIGAALKFFDAFIFSSPSRIAVALADLASDGSLFLHLGVTTGETLLSFVLSTIVGLLLAVLLWWNDFIAKVMAPYLVILNSLPKTALAPIIIVWIGNNVKSVIATAIMTAVVVTVLTIHGGFAEVDKEKLKLIKTLGGTKMQTLTKVVLPASIPTIMSAVKVNIGLCLVGVIVGEFLVAKSGLGYLIVYGSQIFKMDWVLLSVIILCLMAALFYKLVVAMEKKFANWNL